MSDTDILNMIGNMAGLGDDVEVVSTIWGGSAKCDFVPAEAFPDAFTPRHDCNFYLFSTSVIITTLDNMRLVACIELKDVEAFQRKREVLFVGNSFANVPRTAMVIYTTYSAGSKACIRLEGPVADELGRATEALVKFVHGISSETEADIFACHQLKDAVRVIAKYPFSMECVCQENKQDGILYISLDGRVAFCPRQDALQTNARNSEPMRCHLDDIVLVTYKKSTFSTTPDVVITLENRTTFMFQETVTPHLAHTAAGAAGAPTSSSDAADDSRLSSHIAMLWMSHCNLKAHRGDAAVTSADFSPISLSEMEKTYRHFQSIDLDGNGWISQTEFAASMGSLFATSPLPGALFSVFDREGRNNISFPQYLYGCRVLLYGNPEDRLRYFYCLFNPHRQPTITLESFTAALRTVAAHIVLNGRERGESSDALAQRLFEAMDTNHDGRVDFPEFRDAFERNDSVRRALRPLIEQRDLIDRVGATKGGKSVFFGHPNWSLITNILCGIQWGCTTIANQLRSVGELPLEQAISQKLVFNCTTGEVIKTKGGNPGVNSAAFSPRGGDMSSPVLVTPTMANNNNNNNSAVLFADYAPQLFHNIRTKYGIDDESYLSSLGIEQLAKSLMIGRLTSLYEMSSSGRSGSFFFMSYDSRYILKTLPQSESVMLRKILPHYYRHMMDNPDTLVTRFYGLHALVRGNEKIPFVVMGNVFHQLKPIHTVFDLKGSTVNRSTPMQKRGAGVALKDLDFNRKLVMDRDTHDRLVRQINTDSKLLSGLNINDYSFLLGIHTASVPLPSCDESTCPAPVHSNFQRFWGGIPSHDRREVFFVGVIDILTNYDLKKIGEHLGKRILHENGAMSCVPPAEYHTRFVKYLTSILSYAE
eukprot:PhM_4_TR5341/c0_g1_i1/m.32623/K00889/PIP5K; 1-phosphatidylinositol-4-phosphate 5-kinase